ncbi:MAG: hypothetical protein HY360_05195 [Verrucomicrobia bacterium]|nr:hypothetical protein [Verrucomicrobiota bacterium]
MKAFLRVFGSVKLAMVLLAILIGACIVGTVVESRIDTSVAQVYVYDAPWFIAWLTLLCMNLVGSVFARWPLKAHHTGFVVTHAGTVILLLGAIIGRVWGVEGFMTLTKGEAPLNHLVLLGRFIEAQIGDGAERKLAPIEMTLRPPTPHRPVVLSLKDAKVSALDYAEQLGVKTVVEKGDANDPPALRLVLRSPMAAPVDRWLVLNDMERHGIDLGAAVIQFAADIPKAPAQAAPGATENAALQPAREVHFTFAMMPDMGVARPVVGEATGIKAVYRWTSSATSVEDYGVLELVANDKKFSMPVAKLLGKRTRWNGTPWTVHGLQFFADFRMQDKKPVSVSNTPNNPALMFEILGPPAPATAGRAGPPASARAGSQSRPDESPGSLPPGHPSVSGHSSPHAGLAQRNRLRIYYGANGKLRYEADSRKQAATKGDIQMGKEFDPGWADWKVCVTECFDHAVVREELAPLSAENSRGIGAPGLRVQVEKGGRSSVRWIAMGSPAFFGGDGGDWHVTFGHRLHPLNFGVALDDFEVERNEGTQNPAGFRSRLRFLDSAGKTVLQREVWMNHPANFPDFPCVGLLGTAYKFSQSSWNPDNLDETTLQVMRDPGWSLKWIGSLMLCVGIFIMFYLKPSPIRTAR